MILNFYTIIIIAMMALSVSLGYLSSKAKDYHQALFYQESKELKDDLQRLLDEEGSAVFKTALNTNKYTCYVYSTVPTEGFCSMKITTWYAKFAKSRYTTINRMAATTCSDGSTSFDLILTNNSLPDNSQSFYYRGCLYDSPGLFKYNQSTSL